MSVCEAFALRGGDAESRTSGRTTPQPSGVTSCIWVNPWVILLAFGPSRIADVGKGLGEGIRNFKKGLTNDSPEDAEETGPKQLPPSDNHE